MTGLAAGVDEAGRGPLAGPVVVAAVILDPGQAIEGLGDSKKLSEKRREALFPEIQSCSLAWSIVEVGVEEIDRMNILQATLAGMKRAVEQLSPAPGIALIDGNRSPAMESEVRTIVQGDRLIPAISAASILAKVYRDRLMQKMNQLYPGYEFDRHKGYPTARHLQCLKNLGPCEIHRKSFAPVQDLLTQRVLDL